MLLLLLLLSFAFDCVFVAGFCFCLSDAAELSFIDSSGTHINNKLRLSFEEEAANLLDHNYLSVSCHHLLNSVSQLSPLTQIAYSFTLCLLCTLCRFVASCCCPKQAERLSAVVSHFISTSISPFLHLPLHFDYASLSLSLCLFISLTQFRSFFLLFTFYFLLMASRIFDSRLGLLAFRSLFLLLMIILGQLESIYFHWGSI